MPTYTSCLITPTAWGWADGPWCARCAAGWLWGGVWRLALSEAPSPTLNATPLPACRFYEPTILPRPMHVMNMMLEAKHWVQRRWPYWDRRGGRDHIFFMSHDEGAW